MNEYTAKEMRSKAGQMLDDARRGEEVVITRRGAERFVLRYEPESVHSGEHQVTMSQSGSSDDLLAQLVEQSGQQTDLLRLLVERRDTALDDLLKQYGTQPAEEVRPAMVTAQIAERQEGSVQVAPEGPSRQDLEAAYQYFGLQEGLDRLEVTQKGIQSALGEAKRAARRNPDSEEAKALAMGPADEHRIELLRCIQLDKLSKALAKRDAGDPFWLSHATPSRF